MKFSLISRLFLECLSCGLLACGQNTGENKKGLFLWEIRPFCAPRGTRTLGLLVRN